MRLSSIKPGQRATIKNIDTKSPNSIRLLELGFTPGQNIEIVYNTFFNDPLAVSIRGIVIALRRNDASCVEVEF